MERTAKKSSDYVKDLEGLPKNLTDTQKTAKIQQLWNADTGSDKSAAWKRIGQGMVGPIQVKLLYEGFARSILLEDPRDRGFPVPYEVLDDLGQAYVLNQTDAEVKTTPFEGKFVPPTPFRIASFPYIRKEELYFLKANVVEHAQTMTKEAIMKQEDGRLLTLLSSAITDYATNPDHVITPDHIVEIGVGNPIDWIDFQDAVSRVELHELEASTILMNPVDFRDILSWDVNLTGWKFKDKVMDGDDILQFGEFTVRKSIMVPLGTMFLVPEPRFLGVMPVWYSLDVEENNQIEQFRRGWVMDEVIGMVVLNPRGLVAIKKI